MPFLRASTSGASYEISSQQYISFIRKESNMHNVKSPPVNLDKYLEGDKKRYLTYEDAARLFIVQLKYQKAGKG